MSSTTTDRPLVMFVDDDKDLVIAMRLLLGEIGYRVIARFDGIRTVGTGALFWDAPDLFILDLKMGDSLDGTDIARDLRAAGAYCPMIALSGDRNQLEAAAKTGLFAATVEKPPNYPRFLETIKRVIQEGRVTRYRTQPQ